MFTTLHRKSYVDGILGEFSVDVFRVVSDMQNNLLVRSWLVILNLPWFNWLVGCRLKLASRLGYSLKNKQTVHMNFKK